MSSQGAPPLPPRKPSPSPTREGVIFDSPLERSGPLLAGAAPPLPPRKPSPIPPPILTSDVTANKNGESLTAPPTAFAVEVTPATPDTPVLADAADKVKVQQKDFAGAAAERYPPITPGSAQDDEDKSFLPLGQYESAITEQLKGAVPYVPDMSHHSGVSVEWLLVSAVLILLAYIQVSLLWIAILGVAAALWLHKTAGSNDVGDATNLGGAGLNDAQEREAVLWV